MATVTSRVVTESTANAATYASASFTPSAGDLLVVRSSASGTVTAAGTCTGSANGITFTLVANGFRAGSTDVLYLFVANQLVGASPVAMTVTVSTGADPATGANVIATSLGGMTKVGTAAVRQAAVRDNAAIGVPSVTFTSAPLAGNPQLGYIANATNPAGVAPPAGWSSSTDTGYTTPIRGATSASLPEGGTTQTVTWGSSSATAYGAIIAEFDASGGAVAPPVQPRNVRVYNRQALNRSFNY